MVTESGPFSYQKEGERCEGRARDWRMTAKSVLLCSKVTQRQRKLNTHITHAVVYLALTC